MRRFAPAAIPAVLAVAVAAAWCAESPLLSEARRHRGEVSARLAAAEADRSSRGMDGAVSLPGSARPRPTETLAALEGRVTELTRELRRADETLALALRREADRTIGDLLRGGGIPPGGSVASVAALLSEADRRAPVGTLFPPADRGLNDAVHILLSEERRDVSSPEPGIIEEYREHLESLDRRAGAAVKALEERRRGILRLADRSGVGAPAYVRELDAQLGLLSERMASYGAALATLPPRALTR